MSRKSTTTADTDLNDNFAQNFFAALVQNLASDPEKETGKGIDYNFLPYGILVIHRAGPMNKAYQSLVREKYEQNNRNIDDKVSNQIMAEVYAKTIVIGIKTADGAPVSYGKKEQEALAEVLARPDMYDIFSGLQLAANDAANFRKEKIKADAKNSVKS